MPLDQTQEGIMDQQSKTFNYKNLIITVNEKFVPVGKTVSEILEELIVRSVRESSLEAN